MPAAGALGGAAVRKHLSCRAAQSDGGRLGREGGRPGITAFVYRSGEKLRTGGKEFLDRECVQSLVIIGSEEQPLELGPLFK